MPNFFHVFDVDNGKLPCPVRNRSITALQALTLMNSPLVEEAARDFGRRLMKEARNDLGQAIDLGFRMALSRAPTPIEAESILTHLRNCSGCEVPAKGAEKLGWLLMNLDEFLFVK